MKLFTPCPYPGTKYYDDMEKAGRILTKEWNRYDYGSPLIQPTHMTPPEMMDGFNHVYNNFYSLPNIVRRMTPPPKGNYLEALFYFIANLKINKYMRKHKERLGHDLVTVGAQLSPRFADNMIDILTGSRGIDARMPDREGFVYGRSVRVRARRSQERLGFVSGIDGAHFKSDAVTHHVGAPTSSSPCTRASAKYDDITDHRRHRHVAARSGSGCQASLDSKPERRNGALVGYDFDFQERSRRSFFARADLGDRLSRARRRVEDSAALAIKISPENSSSKRATATSSQADRRRTR